MNIEFFRELMEPIEKRAREIGYFTRHDFDFSDNGHELIISKSEDIHLRSSWSRMAWNETFSVFLRPESGIFHVMPPSGDREEFFPLHDPGCIGQIIEKMEKDLRG